MPPPITAEGVLPPFTRQLKAVVCHQGKTAGSGHYVAYALVKHPDLNARTWAYFNDLYTPKAFSFVDKTWMECPKVHSGACILVYDDEIADIHDIQAGVSTHHGNQVYVELSYYTHTRDNFATHTRTHMHGVR